MIRSRYPGYDVMQEADEWDERTRAIVADRLKSPEPLQFFKPDEAEVLMAAAQVLLAEDDEWLRRKVVELIDRQFDKGEGEGYRPQTQPKDGDLWRAGLASLGADRTGADRPGAHFVGAPPQIQTARITALQGDDPIFFQALHKELLSAYCSLPPVWSFMGYGGPAFPRGYVRIELGARDPWEAKPAATVPALPPNGPPLPPGAEQVLGRIEP
ncbi:MAG TPA: gluconate 2-dehydrogenase subunit 3 family protein [Symbiobacteriaceae bacterium]|nr:gluconate 2-dehydrogenase subunit 3 family protein [Symbiobacteriaceae bacterium]